MNPFRVSGWKLICLSALAWCPGACTTEPHGDWEQHAYIWSRDESTDSVDVPKQIGALRILVAQWSSSGDAPWMLKPARPEAVSLPDSAIAVVRLDGTAIAVSAPTVARSLKDSLFKRHAGWKPQAIEIDHDSATARIGDYANWLREFRQEWGAQSPVWITALPDWRRSSSLSELLDAVDAYTLQIHALNANSGELIDQNQAMSWIARFEERSGTPYFVALPTYVLRVGKGHDGGVRFVESGVPIGATAADEQTLFADPTDLAALATRLRGGRSDQRRGIAWFRFPVAGDRSTISMQTFDALIAGQPLERKIEPVLVPVQVGGVTFDISLHNTGVHDTGLPRTVVLGSGCEIGDTASGFRAGQDHRQFDRASQGLLRVGEAQSLGWIRCASSTPQAPTVHW